MNRFFLASGATLIALSSTRPAIAQYYGLGGYGPQNQYQQRIMQQSGWSSGDYFGSPIRQQQPQGNYGSYEPGLGRNINYQANDCARYVNC